MIYINNQKQKGITLFEIMIVTFIVGVLATLAIPTFLARKERIYNDEAIIALKQMHAAERLFRVETGNYYPASGSETDITDINDNLKLDLTEDAWDYSCDSNGCVQATRGSKDYRMRMNEPEPVSGTC